MNEVRISKKRLWVGLLLLALLVTAALGFLVFRRFLHDQKTAQQAVPSSPSRTPDGDQPAQEAALAGAQAFYTVDYQSQPAWIEQLCALSTAIGCAVDRNTLAPTLWVDFVKHKTTTTVRASALSKVLDQALPTRGNVQAQVWRLQIDLSAPWPQQTQPLTHFQALALVLQEQGSWKFERFLTEEETRVYEQGKQP